MEWCSWTAGPRSTAGGDWATWSSGRWVWIGAGNALRCHEGFFRVGDKVVFGANNTLNGYLDIDIGDDCIFADWIYVTDFDHIYDDPDVPIRRQGIVKSPVRIEADCWIGEKAPILRGVTVGRGSVVGAQTVVNRECRPARWWSATPAGSSNAVGDDPKVRTVTRCGPGRRPGPARAPERPPGGMARVPLRGPASWRRFWRATGGRRPPARPSTWSPRSGGPSRRYGVRNGARGLSVRRRSGHRSLECGGPPGGHRRPGRRPLAAVAPSARRPAAAASATSTWPPSFRTRGALGFWETAGFAPRYVQMVAEVPALLDRLDAE